jgi:hypothetical protein
MDKNNTISLIFKMVIIKNKKLNHAKLN